MSATTPRERWLSTGPAAERLGTTHKTIRDMVRDGRLLGVCTPRGYLVDGEDVERVMREREERRRRREATAVITIGRGKDA